MATFEDMMQMYVNADYDELVELAEEAMEELIPFCERIDDDNGGFDLLAMIVLVAIYADGAVAPLERRLLVDGLGMEPDVAAGFLDMYDPGMVDVVFNLADCADEDEFAAMLSLITTFAAVDEHISAEEVSLIRALTE